MTTASDPKTTQNAPSIDVDKVRADFPILAQEVRGKPLTYLDSAASAQKPRQVIDAVAAFDATDYSNVHRGVHELSQRATIAYENAREKVRALLNAASEKEIIFTRGTTEGINLVAFSYGRQALGEGDEVLISHMEHHSNIVPWQLVCQQTGATLKVVPVTEHGELDMAQFDALLSERTKLVAVVHVSNSLGTINPVEEIISKAHARGVPVLLDGAQAVSHMKVDVQALDVDFYAFSGHKLFAPTGIGVLYGKEALLDAMPPWQGGGDMIRTVSFEETTFSELPAKFEAGTPNITGAVGLGAGIDYLAGLDWSAIHEHEAALLAHATEGLSAIAGVRLIGTADQKASVVSFVIEGIHAHDVGTILDQEGIAVRVGHHCTQPLMAHFEVPATVRASLAFYNTHEEIDRLLKGVQTVVDIFG